MTAPDNLEPGLDALAVLTDPVRRAAYRFVADRFVADGDGPVGRDEVASALGIGRSLAAFHLDKLVDAGLLEVSYARRSGRSGPGAGRPAKLYQRAPGEHVVSVPPRAYRSAAALLAEAVERAGADATLYKVAHEHGHASGSRLGSGSHSGSGAGSGGRDLVAALTVHGYEPVPHGDEIRLRNCPFHQLATDFAPIACGMNLALLQGLLDGADLSEWQARIDPTPGHCCVVFSKTNEG
jgi:predicted ArsR family transcriptional regulator